MLKQPCRFRPSAATDDRPTVAPYPLVRCRSCGWVHVGTPRPEPAGDRCYRCKGPVFEVIDRDEFCRTVPPGVTLQTIRWPPIIRPPSVPKDKLTAADIERPSGPLEEG
jgi:hypothetical protein